MYMDLHVPVVDSDLFPRESGSGGRSFSLVVPLQHGLCQNWLRDLDCRLEREKERERERERDRQTDRQRERGVRTL